MEKIYSVTELARDLDITPRTIRFYEDQGLIAPQRAGATRVYTHRDRARMILILRGKRLGFSIKEIKEFLDLYVVDVTQTEQMQLLLTKVRERSRQLEEQRRALDQTLRELKDIEKLTVEALAQKGAVEPA
ncbi:MerR family transcriptional regulator [Rhizomicrobium electricum]|uniref:MerR family DNA-binding transcriptional regulator n=1 Tax=Rhizomicrobium electricum TaxID=480070 RepID=A0ABN1EN28_9PROT|nr:MerR family DNA-binding transcriptional regulator [Rhizomicrobium electricum]NIJ47024.1 DNA-binding transcriptional MerR regulator [Rhizomicrobium electricum]